jgi:hypothetical protein
MRIYFLKCQRKKRFLVWLLKIKGIDVGLNQLENSNASIGRFRDGQIFVRAGLLRKKYLSSKCCF